MSIAYIVNAKRGTNVYQRALNILSEVNNSSIIKGTVKCEYSQNLSNKLRGLVSSLSRQFVLIHIFEPFGPSFIFIPLYILLGKKVIYQTGDLHFQTAKLSKPPFLRRSLIFISEILHYKLSSKILVGSPTALQIVSYMLHINQSNITYIPDGRVDLKYKELGTPKIIQQIKEKNGTVMVYAASFRFLHLGGTKLVRGWELIDLVERLVFVYKVNVYAIILGDGPGISILKNMVERKDLSSRIYLLGNQEKLQYFEYLNGADICFLEGVNHPSYAVMNPTKLIDYMSFGKPILTSNVSQFLPPSKCVLVANPLEADLSNLEKYLTELSRLVLGFVKFSTESRTVDCLTDYEPFLKSWNEVGKMVLEEYGVKLV